MFERKKTRDVSGAKPAMLERFVIFGSLAGLALLQLFMAWTFEVNWDEFYRLADIYRWKAGTLGSVLQTNYVYAFGWLEQVHRNEVYQIIAARGVMYLLLVYSCILLFLLARYFFDSSAAGVTLIAYLSFSFVFRHATSFRIDMPILALLLTALLGLILTKRNIWHYVLAGICLGVAGSLSIKAALHIPTISVILLLYWWRSGWHSRVLLKSLFLGIVATFTFLISIYFHNLSLPDVTAHQELSGYAVSGSVFGFFPQMTTLRIAIEQNILFVLFFLAGILLSFLHLKNEGTDRFKTWLLLSVSLLPLLSFLFYIHTYAYFYVTLLATGSLMIGACCFHLKQTYKKSGALIAVLIFIPALPMMIASLNQTNAYQIQINDVVHDMFPGPVDYIDRSSQISSFSKQGLFMTAVQVREYRALGHPIMRRVFENTPPQFLIANIDSLDLDIVRDEVPARRLLSEDEAILIENFIHHWGPIYVPGKRLTSKAENVVVRIELPGIYTIESETEVLIDGLAYSAMRPIYLKKGDHIIDLKENDVLTLRWGDGLYLPEFEPLGEMVFRGF